MNVNNLLAKDYEQWTLGERGKNKPNTKPKQTQFKPNTNPIQSQFKPKQTQFQREKMLLCMTINTRRKSFGYYADEIEAPNVYDRASAAGTSGRFLLIAGAALSIIDGLM
jgi:hypothetical protein